MNIVFIWAIILFILTLINHIFTIITKWIGNKKLNNFFANYTKVLFIITITFDVLIVLAIVAVFPEKYL